MTAGWWDRQITPKATYRGGDGHVWRATDDGIGLVLVSPPVVPNILSDDPDWRLVLIHKVYAGGRVHVRDFGPKYWATLTPADTKEAPAPDPKV